MLPFPARSDSVLVRVGGLARAIFPVRRRSGAEAGLYFAPSFELVALGGPELPSIAISAGVAGLEWY